MFFLPNPSHCHQSKSLALQALAVSDSHINAKEGIILKSSYSQKSNFLKKKKVMERLISRYSQTWFLKV